jgi:hypothetical protein
MTRVHGAPYNYPTVTFVITRYRTTVIGSC